MMRSLHKLTANLWGILAGIQPVECKVNMTIDVELKGLSTISQDIHNGMIFLHATALSMQTMEPVQSIEKKFTFN
jgi:hypothetical protein